MSNSIGYKRSDLSSHPYTDTAFSLPYNNRLCKVNIYFNAQTIRADAIRGIRGWKSRPSFNGLNFTTNNKCGSLSYTSSSTQVSALYSNGHEFRICGLRSRSSYSIDAASPFTANRMRMGYEVSSRSDHFHTNGHSTGNIHQDDAIIMRREARSKLTRECGSAVHIADHRLTNFYKNSTMNTNGRNLSLHFNS